MNKQSLKDAVMWGIILWFTGYVLGIVLFMVVSPAVLGWIIMPIGVLITLWVLVKKVNSASLEYYLFLGAIWTVIAIVFDYLFLVKVFNPADGYYKLDVYLYYVLTFILPVWVGWKKSNQVLIK